MKAIIFYIQKTAGKTTFIFCFFIALILLNISPKTCLADAKRIFEDNKRSVVILFSYDKEGHQTGQATGFIVRTDGVVLTNYHFISNAAEIKIRSEDRMLDVKGLLYVDRKNDLALLKIEGNNLSPVRIRDKGIGPEGQTIYMIGSPRGEDKILFDGTLSRIKDISTERKLLLMTAPVTKGSSGSPVFNETGEVIGIANFIINEAQPYYFAMPVSQIKSSLSLKKTTPFDKADLIASEYTAEYWFNLGAAYDSLGMYTDASGAYQRALEIDPDDATAHNNLGVIYTNLNIYSFAIREHNEAIRLRPGYQEAYFNLGMAYIKSDFDQAAIETFKKAISLKPYDAKSQHNLAVALGKSGKLNEAIEAFKQAIHSKPDYAEAYYNLGIAHYQMNMNQEALQAFKRSIEINPDFSKAHFWLGVIYSTQDPASAIKEYEILRDLDQSTAMVLHKVLEVRGNIGPETPGSAPAGSEKTIAKAETTGTSSGTISPPSVPAAPQESQISKKSIAPVKVPISSDKLDRPVDISNQETPGKSRRPPKKDLYSVQVSVFNSKKNADALVMSLSKKGYNVFLEKEEKVGRYRVLVGKFTEKDKAVKQARTILRKEKIESVIFKH